MLCLAFCRLFMLSYLAFITSETLCDNSYVILDRAMVHCVLNGDTCSRKVDVARAAYGSCFQATHKYQACFGTSDYMEFYPLIIRGVVSGFCI